MRATTLSRPGRAEYRSMSRPLVPRNWARVSALRDSNPESSSPSFTHWLRISCERSSTDSSAIVSSLMRLEPPALEHDVISANDPGLRLAPVCHCCALRVGRRDAEHQQPAFLPPLGFARVGEVLEVGVGLALGHHTP